MGKLHIWSLTFRSCVKLVLDLLIVFFGPLPFGAMSIWLLLLTFGRKLLTCQMNLIKKRFLCHVNNQMDKQKQINFHVLMLVYLGKKLLTH